MHERPNEGQTIIEKIEGQADVKFAVMVMTEDDCGGLRDDEAVKYRSRARQNVIFELGYFLGLLGSKKVCALHEQGWRCPRITAEFCSSIWTTEVHGASDAAASDAGFARGPFVF